MNAMVAAEPMTGYKGNKAAAIDHRTLAKVLKKYGRLAK